MRVLFILKLHTYGYNVLSNGLFNSASFLVDMLNANGQTAKLVQVIDNNSIDKEVTAFRPNIVVIEALWVVPSKFAILAKLHPKVKWVIRGHSDLPFLAHEGVAMKWLFEYRNYKNVSIAFNCPRTYEDFHDMLPGAVVSYLPNYYPIHFTPKTSGDSTFRVGCFGALRPLKNQLTQAVAAVRHAESTGRDLEFHINSTRQEGDAGILPNLQALFAATGYKLVEHPWMSHADFLALMRTMNVAMAVSLSETFCITAADAVASGVPLICSDQIPWADLQSQVNATDVDAMVQKLDGLGSVASFHSEISNRNNLRQYSMESRRVWLNYLQPSTI